MTGRLMVVIGYNGAELLDIACVTSALDTANRVGATPPYQILLVSPSSRPIRCNSGLELAAQRSLERFNGTIDTLVVSGGLGHETAAADQRLVGHVRRLSRQSRRVASVCTGASILAASGLLDGRRATTHWMYADQLAQQYPRVTVDPTPIFIRDGDIATSGGVTAALDLTLSFIEEDHGPELARWVAMGMVTYLQRPGDQRQMSTFVAVRRSANPVMRKVLDHVAGNLDGDLSTASLASLAGVSERHLTRLSVQHLNRTPGRLVRDLRLDAAAHLLRTTQEQVDAISKRCGFASAETLRQAFTVRFGASPSRFRTPQSLARRP